ncbi:MAG TPA: DUF5696 domain-containing protein [Paenibacillus sp.]|nr:DUF5696 domain-containing protein [Paenibacillus sp.]
MSNHLKRMFAIPIAVVLVLGVSVSAISFAEQEAPAQTEAASAAAEPAGTSAAYVLAAENDETALYVNSGSLGIKVRNKRTGYTWSGTLDEKDESMNGTWQNFFQSGISIEYMDAKNKVRTASVTGEEAKVALRTTSEGFSAAVDFDKLGIRLTLEARLAGDSIEFRIPFDSIEESGGGNRLQSVFVYPFFGGTKGVRQEEGYMLIPDGSGALVRLNEPTIATQPYIGRVYGDDLGMKGSPALSDSFALPPEQVHLPAYGIAHETGKDAFAALIEGGAAYAEIRSYPSGVTTDYNWTAAKWIYRETYFQPVDLKGNGITLNQERKNRFDAGLKLMLLGGEDADYSGMAKRIREELASDGMLPQPRRADAEARPLQLEVVVAETKKELVGSKVISMTTAEQLDDILSDLRAGGVEDVSVVVSGYSEGGSAGASPQHLPFEAKTGGASDWKAVAEKYEAIGVPMYFFADYVVAWKAADGYGERDLALTAADQLLSLWPDVWLLHPPASERLFDAEAKKFAANGISRLALGSVGNNLFSSNAKPAVSREDAMAAYQSMLTSEDIRGFVLFKPHAYLWKHAERIADLPTTSSQFLMASEEVPFLQMVLKGYVDYYAAASNFHANPEEELLKLIDYGSYPSFYVTYNEPTQLLGTNGEWLYTSQYAVWKDRIAEEYKAVSEALRPVQGARFEDRTEVREGVFKNTYSNGATIYINYTSEEATVDGSAIPPRAYLVKGGDGHEAEA